MPPNLFKELQFIFPWRSYQKNFLENFSSHISDDHFHVIAPPGSGKTVLGIEIVKRLGKRTLILAPTLTIRNQWEDRLQQFFLKEGKYSDVSFDIKSLSNITFSTYQSLHSFYKTFKEKEDYFKYFKDQGIEALVLDEAHHLKNEWWKCLFSLKESSLYTIVALTATPPYDSERNEITKYFKLCGEVDDEIATPDLVKEKNLCPHQDYVFFSKPNDAEINYIVDFRRKISDFIDELRKDEQFINFLKSHRFYSNTENVLYDLYEKSELFSAVLIFLKSTGITIPIEKLTVLGFEKNDTVEIPKLTKEWVEILFQNLLFNDRLELIASEDYLLALEKRLRKLHILENNRVDLIGNKNIYKSLSSSPSKLKSINAIVNHEYESLQKDLRGVILTDYIRNEFLDLKDHEIVTINKLGVIPIFQYLRVSIPDKKVLAVLTGSLVIIHASILAEFYLLEDNGFYNTIPLRCDAEYVSITAKSSAKKTLVHTITKLFEAGKIQILIGTKALLGEGWDAPSINALILASFVGSFVTSNQMRGRAIRTENNNPKKTGNIWHLACVDPTIDEGGKDFEILKRRFDAFLGISNTEKPYIASGIDRLLLPKKISLEEIDSLNNHTLSKSSNRSLLIQKWEEAIYSGEKLTREIKLFHQGDKPYKAQRKIYYNDAVKYAFVELIITISFFVPEFLLKNLNVLINKGPLYFFYTLGAFLALNYGKKTYNAFKLYFKYGMIHKDIESIAYSILHTLNELHYLNTDLSQIKIESELLSYGDVTCGIKGANQIESSLFINALNELLQPISNPKYLIIKSNWFRHKLKIQNYFAVPNIFGDKKDKCMIFLKHWNSNIGRSKIFYTRNFEGRKMLVKARLFHVSSALKDVTKKSIVWK